MIETLPKITNHTQLLNFIIKKIGAKSYGEIGIYNPDHNFNLIRCDYKFGIDPDPKAKATYCMTSDEYFKQHLQKVDVWFCDGFHHSEQVKYDIINSWNCLNDGGILLIHDCNPHSERITHEPRDSGEWCGGVFRTVSQIATPKFTISIDYGCCILHKSNGASLAFYKDEITWDYFNRNRKQLLNLVSIEEGIKLIEAL